MGTCLEMRGSEDEESEPSRKRADWRCSSTPLSERHGRSPRILVVDDNQDARDYLTLMLELQGHKVAAASDGIEALEIAERFRPDIIFLDIQMPRLSGIEVCGRLRATPWGREISIYAVTGLNRAEDYARSRHSGFDGHLVKPVDPATLNSLVSRPLSAANVPEHEARHD
jgi:CheY-like chemotaxis protein